MIQKSPNGKLYFYRFAMKATGGQCLMKPPETDELPIFWYNFGGVFFNLMMILIQFGLLFVFKHRIVLYFLLIGIFVHLFLLVTNWLWMPGISNDGANYRLLKKRKMTRYCFKELLNLHALVAEGHRLSEVDLSQHSHHILKEDSIQINFMQNVYQWHRYRFEFDDAKRILDELLNANPQGIIKLLLEADNYVLSLVMDQAAEKDIRVMKVIKMMKAVPSYAMVPVLEELRDNKAPKQETYLNFIKACDSSHLPGEAEDEKRFLEKLIEHKINRSEEA